MIASLPVGVTLDVRNTRFKSLKKFITVCACAALSTATMLTVGEMCVLDWSLAWLLQRGRR